VSLAEHYGGYAVSTIGAALTTEPPDTLDAGYRLNADPQVLYSGSPITDTINWVLITDTIVSRGDNEMFLTIGNFFTDGDSDTVLFNPSAQLEVAYYFIDDVSVIALDSVPSSIEEQDELSFELWPNPATDVLYIRGSEHFTEARLLDMAGREVLRSSGRQPLQMGIAHLPKGLYLVEATDSEGRRAVKKVLKE
jgi:hypothetical protein